jgi:endonuclease/exonuclease/phosphatase family metal-dependent hydrolase
MSSTFTSPRPSTIATTSMSRFSALLIVLIILAGCTPHTDRAPQATIAGVPESQTAFQGSIGPVESPVTIGALSIEPAAPAASGLRIATFNVEFLFDGLEPEGEATFPWKGDSVAAASHRAGVGAIIRQLDADVVMLQEVENEEVLRMLIDEHLADLGYGTYFVQGHDTFTRQNVGMLSRIPVEQIGRTDERAPVAGTRDEYGVTKNMWARLSLGGVPTTIVGIHLLARPNDEQRAARREAQASVMASLVNGEMNDGREVIVLGDFNDYEPEIPDRAGSVPIARTLAIMMAAGEGLVNVISTVPRDERFTSFWDRNRNLEIESGELTAIDHILLSPGLLRALVATEYVHSHDPRHGPDHFPIVITLGL